MGRRAVLLALVTPCLAWPAVAMGAQGQLINCDPSPPAPTQNENCTMVYNGDGSEANDAVLTLVDGGVNYQVHDANAAIAAQTPCFLNGTDTTTMKCPAGFVIKFSASLGDGNDRITVTANLPSAIGGGGGRDVLNGGPAADVLNGGDGEDAISAGAGNDTVNGQAGNDTIASASSDGADVDNGGDGVDTMTFAGRTQTLNVTLDGLANDGQASEGDNVQTDVENVTGGDAGDTISGSDASNALDGGGGSDLMNGAGGPDALVGGTGDDTENGGDGGDLVDGGDGNDLLFGDAGDDQLLGGAGNDPIQGGDGTDDLEGGAGDDALDGSGGPDLMVGGDGVDKTNYANRTEPLAITLDGNANDGAAGEGDNVQTDVEDILSGSGADTLIGSPAANRIDGGAGENYEDGAAGADTLIGGASGDVLRTRGSADGDVVNCGPGPDFVVAKPADTIAADCDRADRGVNQKPKLRDSAVVAPVRGTLQMSPAGIVRRVPLQDKVVLPVSSIVDTLAGAVKVTSSATARKVQWIMLDSGTFDITQTAAKLAVTQFSLLGGDFSVCAAAARGTRSATAAAKPKTVRGLWASGKGQFRTKGRYATAAIRGTRWQTVDRCDGTLVRVTVGAVTVRDLVKKTNVVVKAGHSYLAKAR